MIIVLIEAKMYTFKVSKRVEDIIKTGIQQLDMLNVPISKNVYFFECGGSSRYGYCTSNKHKGYDYSIAINKYIISDDDILNVAIHELLHTVYNHGATAHKGNWLKWANYVNSHLDIDIRVSSRKRLSEEAYKQRKSRRRYYDISEYDKKTMEIVECPSCHKQICIKKGGKRYSDGQSRYICTKCNKPMYYHFPPSKYADVNIAKRAIFVNDFVKGKVRLSQSEILSCMPYLNQRQCDSIAVAIFSNEIQVFLDRSKSVFVSRLMTFSSVNAYKDMANLILDDKVARLHTASKEEIDNLLMLFSKTKYKSKLAKHFNKRNKKVL